MDGERMDSELDLAGDGARDRANAEHVVLLTDRRVIYLDGKHRPRRAVFASIEDVDAVEIAEEDEGLGAFVWAALAFVAALFLYFVIDNFAGKISGTVAVALLGVYLIVDRLISPGRRVMVFKTGPADLRCPLKKGDRPADDIYPFINRLFELKAASGSDGLERARRFAPR